MNTVEVLINGVRYRLVRDGLELSHDDGKFWESVDTDRDPTPAMVVAFEALELIGGVLG